MNRKILLLISNVLDIPCSWSQCASDRWRWRLPIEPENTFVDFQRLRHSVFMVPMRVRSLEVEALHEPGSASKDAGASRALCSGSGVQSANFFGEFSPFRKGRRRGENPPTFLTRFAPLNLLGCGWVDAFGAVWPQIPFGASRGTGLPAGEIGSGRQHSHCLVTPHKWCSRWAGLSFRATTRHRTCASQFLQGSKSGGTCGNSNDQRPLRQKVSKHIKASSPVLVQNWPARLNRT